MPSTPLHGVHFRPRHFEVSSGVSSTQTLTARYNQSLFPDWKNPVSFSPERRANDFQIVLAWREGMPEIPRESRGVKGLGRVIGVFSPPPLNTLAGLNQFRTITLWLVPSTPLHGSAIAMDGCQECLRESRGDRVMSHDERTCTDASTWHVQFLLSW